jgi:hypothetical protein
MHPGRSLVHRNDCDSARSEGRRQLAPPFSTKKFLARVRFSKNLLTILHSGERGSGHVGPGDSPGRLPRKAIPMPLSFELANSAVLISDHQRRLVRSYVMTLQSLGRHWDCTKGELHKAAAAPAGIPVFVVSYLYEPTIGTGAINLLWREKFYCMEFGMPSRVGRDKAYIATRLTTITQREAMARAQDEFNAAKAMNTASQPAAPGAAYTSFPRSNYANTQPTQYANLPPTQYANVPPTQYANLPPTQYANLPPTQYANVQQ